MEAVVTQLENQSPETTEETQLKVVKDDVADAMTSPLEVVHPAETSAPDQAETPAQNTENSPKSSRFSKLKNWGRAGVLSALMAIGFVTEGNSQIHDLSITPDGKISVLLTDMGQERVYWDEISPKVQSTAISYIDSETGETVWIFGTANDEILINEVDGEIINTTVDGKQARKFIFDHTLLPEGVEFRIKTDLVTSDLLASNQDSSYTTQIFTEIDGNNVRVNEIKSDVYGFDADPSITRQHWYNKISVEPEDISVEPTPEGGTKISIPVLGGRDGSADIPLDLSNGQTEAFIGYRTVDGEEVILDNVEINLEDSTISATFDGVIDNFEEIWVQHPAWGKVEYQYMDVDTHSAPERKITFTNPVRQSFEISIPEGVQVDSYVIYDMNGRAISQGKRSEDIDMVSFLSSGQYLLQLSGNGWQDTQRFIKE